MSRFRAMKIRRILKAAAVVQLARFAINRRRRVVLHRQRRRNASLGAIALVSGGALAFWLLSRRETTPAWQQKKQRKEARREAARRERERPSARPSGVHVEANADTSLRVPLGEQKR